MTSQATTYAIDFYYDAYEKDFGDGFYPLVKTHETVESTMKEIAIQFQLIHQTWKQTSGDMIYGLDGDTGKIVLDMLNAKSAADSHKVGTQIQNNATWTIYPKTR